MGWLALATTCRPGPPLVPARRFPPTRLAIPLSPPRPGGPAGSRGPRSQRPRDCAGSAGQPPPEPLDREYTGLAAKARCQREVYTIMGGVTHFLGVKCEYCHVKNEYETTTHRKSVANWMARELIPQPRKEERRRGLVQRLPRRQRQGHAEDPRQPARPALDIEWMTAHLTEHFQPAKGNALFCKSCHKGTLGARSFRGRLS